MDKYKLTGKEIQLPDEEMINEVIRQLKLGSKDEVFIYNLPDGRSVKIPDSIVTKVKSNNNHTEISNNKSNMLIYVLLFVLGLICMYIYNKSNYVNRRVFI